MNPKAVPMAPGALPLLGHLVALLRDPRGVLESLPAHGDVVGLRVGPMTTVVVCDPSLLDQVLRNDRVFDKGGLIYDQARGLLRNGLVTCLHAAHRRQRRLVQPAFHASRFDGYTRTMSAEAVAVTESWHEGQVLDVLAETRALMARITTETMFSRALPPAVLRQAVDDVIVLVSSVFRQMLVPAPLDRLPTRGNRRFRRAYAGLQRTLETVIAKRRADGTDHGDLLAAVLSARDTAADGGGLSDTEIMDQVMTFFSAGTETTGTSLAWALHLVAQHPDIERRLHDEVDAVLAGRAPTQADLPRLEVTRRVFLEATRLWPPIWLLTRVTAVDTELGGFDVPAGATVLFSPYMIHRRPDLYPEPDRFEPDRWAYGREPARNAFVAFGGGARKCIGERFGIAEAVLALATIASRWRLESVPGPLVRAASRNGILYPRRLRMRVVARTSARAGKDVTGAAQWL
jgi:pentalenene oxygenase